MKKDIRLENREQIFEGFMGFRKGNDHAMPVSGGIRLGLVFFLTLMLTLNGLMAQEPAEPYLVGSGTFADKDAQLEQLFFGANPSVYITNGQITLAGPGNPLTLFCDPASTSRLYESHPAFQEVELIRFNIQSAEELLMTLDLKGLEQFPNLKYISFVFGFDACGNGMHDCLKDQVKKIIQDQDTSLGITYQFSIPE
ncbi:MAG: hypothetical protein RBS53_11600 [Bacteroidales bacterium]|jgi:hypothetical protein|nr:hypothetical protein [Bacteroidales bacterium]NLM93388.1 hypothetical protein [Bacteroidales bacterium]